MEVEVEVVAPALHGPPSVQSEGEPQCMADPCPRSSLRCTREISTVHVSIGRTRCKNNDRDVERSLQKLSSHVMCGGV